MSHSRMKYEFQRRIQYILYGDLNTKLCEDMQAILHDHAVLTGHSCFYFKGDQYGSRQRGASAPIPLEDVVLQQRLTKHLDQMKRVDQEIAYVNSYLTAIFNTGTYVPTYLALLPSCLHKAITSTPSEQGPPPENIEEIRARVMLYNTKGESLLKARVLKNTVNE